MEQKRSQIVYAQRREKQMEGHHREDTVKYSVVSFLFSVIRTEVRKYLISELNLAQITKEPIIFLLKIIVPTYLCNYIALQTLTDSRQLVIIVLKEGKNKRCDRYTYKVLHSIVLTLCRQELENFVETLSVTVRIITANGSRVSGFQQYLFGYFVDWRHVN